jgi:hypothetical protein
MKNLTSLLQFIQSNHKQIHSVSFKHCIFNKVRIDIVFEDTRDHATIELINTFISRFNAQLTLDSCNELVLFIIVDINN